MKAGSKKEKPCLPCFLPGFHQSARYTSSDPRRFMIIIEIIMMAGEKSDS